MFNWKEKASLLRVASSGCWFAWLTLMPTEMLFSSGWVFSHGLSFFFLFAVVFALCCAGVRVAHQKALENEKALLFLNELALSRTFVTLWPLGLGIVMAALTLAIAFVGPSAPRTVVLALTGVVMAPVTALVVRSLRHSTLGLIAGVLVCGLCLCALAGLFTPVVVTVLGLAANESVLFMVDYAFLALVALAGAAAAALCERSVIDDAYVLADEDEGAVDGYAATAMEQSEREAVPAEDRSSETQNGREAEEGPIRGASNAARLVGEEGVGFDKVAAICCASTVASVLAGFLLVPQLVSTESLFAVRSAVLVAAALLSMGVFHFFTKSQKNLGDVLFVRFASLAFALCVVDLLFAVLVPFNYLLSCGVALGIRIVLVGFVVITLGSCRVDRGRVPLWVKKAVALILAGFPVGECLGVALKQAVGFDGSFLTIGSNAAMAVVSLAALALLFAWGSSHGLVVAKAFTHAATEATFDEAAAVALRQAPEQSLEVASKIVNQRRAKALAPYGLTERELDVALCALDGMSAKAIGQQLYVSESTVRYHLSHIYKKVGVASRNDFLDLLSD